MVIHGSGICSSWKHRNKQNASQWVRHNVVHPCGIPYLNKKEVFIYQCMCIAFIGLPRWLSGKKESACQCRRHRRPEFDPWIGKILWRRKWQPTPGFLPGESHEQRSWAVPSMKSQKSQTRLSNWVSTVFRQCSCTLSRLQCNVATLRVLGRQEIYVPWPTIPGSGCIRLAPNSGQECLPPHSPLPDSLLLIYQRKNNQSI